MQSIAQYNRFISMPNRFLKIHPDDNVGVALTNLKTGEVIAENGFCFTLTEDIPAKHKFTLTALQPQDDIRMYGLLVGKAVRPIPQGAAITTQNVRHQTAGYAYTIKTPHWNPPDVSRWKNRNFMGYHRSDGQVGVANYWLVIPLVFCENRNVQVIKMAFNEALGYNKKNLYADYTEHLVDLYRNNKLDLAQPALANKPAATTRTRVFKNIDGIKFLTHEGGCGGTRQDAEALCALLAGYLHNPNVAVATVLSLGCQNAQIDILKEKIYKLNPAFSKPLIVLEQQKEGTEQNFITKALYHTFMALAKANEIERRPAPLSKLVVGLECGGSDGFSGISANPAVGHATDLLVALGGAAILSEFPELCGVEQQLIDRCLNKQTATRFTELMHTYARRAEASGSGFDMNPSPGNIKDGLITDAMKSAGAAKKGGTSPVIDVLDYGEYVKHPGLNLLCTPGNDVESTTAMAGAGANIILFSTGLGTPTGNPVAPVIKIASNTNLARRMPDIIDINAGSIIDGVKTIAETGEEILEYMIRVASGETITRAMELQQDDFIPWKRGVSL